MQLVMFEESGEKLFHSPFTARQIYGEMTRR